MPQQCHCGVKNNHSQFYKHHVHYICLFLPWGCSTFRSLPQYHLPSDKWWSPFEPSHFTLLIVTIPFAPFVFNTAPSYHLTNKRFTWQVGFLFFFFYVLTPLVDCKLPEGNDLHILVTAVSPLPRTADYLTSTCLMASAGKGGRYGQRTLRINC